MSTILDSLKKSSNKRDGHQQTSIDSFNFSDSNKTSKSGIVMIIILMIITAITLVYGYKYINSEEGTTRVTETQKTNPAATEQQVKVDNPLVAEQSGNIAKKLEKPNSETVKKQLSENQIQATQQTNNINVLDSAQKDNSTQNEPAKNELGTIATETKSNPNNLITQKTNRSEQTTAERPMIKLSLPEDSNNKKKEEQISQVATQEYMYVYQLPFAVRKEIPKFKLNIHIYDENPENRVAVINGSKFEVDELIEELILVKDIVREGVLLEFNGNVFLVPIL